MMKTFFCPLMGRQHRGVSAPLHIYGWIYGVHDGLLRDLGASISTLEEREVLPSIDQRALEPNEP